MRPVPYDEDAEGAALGSMMLQRSAVEVGVQRLVAEDFWTPRHRAIFLAIVACYRAGQFPTPVTVHAACAEHGSQHIVGGLAGIMAVQAATPASTEIAAYVDIIVEVADRRRLIQLADRIAETAADQTSDIDEIVTDARVGIDEVQRASGPKTHPPFAVWREGVDMSVDWIVPAILERRDRVVLVAREGVGKLVDVTTPIPTPFGWRKIGELRVGDAVFDADGHPTEIVAVSGVEEERPCYRLRFDDGAEITAADTHLWETVDYRGRQYGKWEKRIRTTREIAETLTAREGHTVNHAIATCAPLQYGHDLSLPVDPYVLGYWLGNGSRGQGLVTTGGANGTSDTDWVVERFRLAGYECNSRRKLGRRGTPALGHAVGVKALKAPLRELNILTNKRIPERYLRSSVDQRLAVLRGLLDSDGTVRGVAPESKRGNGAATIEWCGCAPVGADNGLAADMLDLLWGLGVKATPHESDARLYGRVTSRRTRITFQTDLPVFSLPRKARELAAPRTRRARTRYIVAAEPVDPVPCVCIQVASPSSMYLLGEQCVPTHNSHLLRQWALMVACGAHWFSGGAIRPTKTIVIDVENSPRQIRRNTERMWASAHNHRADFDEGNFIIMPYNQLDITRRADRLDVESYLAGERPGLLVIGPLYKIMPPPTHKVNYEEAALRGMAVIDDWRARYDLAVLMEHHAPKKESEPLGSSAWMRWPEYGITLEPTRDNPNIVDLSHFRGQREQRPWPQRMLRSNEKAWQWTAIDYRDPNAEHF